MTKVCSSHLGECILLKEKKMLLTVVVPQLQCLSIAGADPEEAGEARKALLSFGGFCHLPPVPPVTGSSVNFSLWSSITDF